MSLQFTDVCFITENVLKLRAFYERLFNTIGEGDEIHSFIHAPGLGIAEPSSPEVMPWRAKRFSLRDPDGNLICIRSWPKE